MFVDGWFVVVVVDVLVFVGEVVLVGYDCWEGGE